MTVRAMPPPLVPEDRGRPQYSGSVEFNSLVRHMLAARCDLRTALQGAEADPGCPVRVREVLRKTSVAAGSLSDPVWAGGLSEYSRIVAAYVESLASVSFFDRALSDGSFVRVPPGSLVSIVTQGAVGSVVDEGGVAPVSSMTLAGPRLVERKAVASVIVTNELAANAGATSLIGRQLQSEISRVTDVTAVAAIIAAGTSAATAGGTAANLITDISASFNAIAIGEQSRLYFVLNAALAASLSARLAGSVGWAMTPTGGTLAGVPAVVSSGVPTGNLVLIDAGRFAASSDTITLDVTRQASLQMSSTPDSPPTGATVLVNLWQENKTGLRAVRFFGIQALAGTTASHVTTGMS